MKALRFDVPSAPGLTIPDVEVLLDEGRVKIRRIDLAAGAAIPPCQMKEDVVFVVLAGRVAFTSESMTETIEAPGAVHIPGGDSTRSMKAEVLSPSSPDWRSGPSPSFLDSSPFLWPGSSDRMGFPP